MADWKKPTTLGLAEKLRQVNTQLRDLIPKLAEAQCEAVKRMAETAIAAQPQRTTPEEKPHE